MKIEIMNPVECRVKKSFARALFPCLSFKAEYWQKGKIQKQDGTFLKERKEYNKSLFIHKDNLYWYFWKGLLPRVERFCERKKIPLELIDNSIDTLTSKAPSLDGLVFRDDQVRMINAARKFGRGIIKAPTGSGKTVIQLGIVSAFRKHKCLILAHRVDIVQQTYDELVKYGFDPAILGGSHKELTDYPKVLAATMQTYVKFVKRGFDPTHFDVVIIDELHHVCKIQSTYSEILSNTHAPIRLGFTATLNPDTEAQFVSEGLLGPLIGELSIEEAVDLGILAEPKIKLVKSRYNPKVRELRKYAEVYDAGITNNKHRNQMIVNMATDYAKEGKTVLIMVNMIEHGENISEEGGFTFVRGITSAEARDRAKKLLIDKKLKVVVTTNVWREGINIPSLDVVINGGGGKSEIATLQAIGRGLRKTDKKDKVIIVDFFDNSHNYLTSHAGERICLYMENNWL